MKNYSNKNKKEFLFSSTAIKRIQIYEIDKINAKYILLYLCLKM